MANRVSSPKRPRRFRKFQALTALLVVVCLAMLPGCWGRLELEERSFVTLMGVDRAESGGLLVTAIIALPRALGRGAGVGGGGGMAGASLMLSGAGSNVEEALRQVELQNAREVSTVYLTFVVLGEEFASSDVGPVIDVFSRHLHYKPNTLVAVCKGRAYKFLEDFHSLEEVEPSQSLLKLITSSHDTLGACPMITMHEFMVGFNTISTDPWAPYIGLASAASAEQAARSEKADESSGADQGGGDAKEVNKPEARKVLQTLGAALFSKVGPVQKMVGTLDTWESMAALILNNDLKTGLINVKYPGDQSETTIVVNHSSASKNLELDKSSPEARFHVVATASLSESPAGAELPETQQEFRQALLRTVQEQLLSLLQRTFAKIAAMDSDVLGLGRLAQMRYPTYMDWEASDWHARFPGTAASFDVEVHILTAGFTLEKPVPR